MRPTAKRCTAGVRASLALGLWLQLLDACWWVGRHFKPVHTCLHHHRFAGLHHSPMVEEFPSSHCPAAGQALCALERYDAAVEDLRQAVRLSPENEKVGGRQCCASVCMLNQAAAIKLRAAGLQMCRGYCAAPGSLGALLRDAGSASDTVLHAAPLYPART